MSNETRLVGWQDPEPVQIQSLAVASGEAEAATGARWTFDIDNQLGQC